MNRAVFTLALCLSSLLANAQESQTEYNFLRVPVSAHAAAVGGDNITLIEDDETMIFQNPALLSSVSDKTINFNYMNYMAGVNMMSASFNRVINDHESWAASAQYLDYGNMKETDENNNQTGTFNAKDIALAGYFSYMLTDRLAGGITAKFIQSYIGEYNSSAVDIDLGLNYYNSDKGWSLSLVAKNLGGQIKAYDENYEKMPIDVQMGITKELKDMPIRLHFTMVDMNHWNYIFRDHLAIGIDADLSQNIWVGAGYNLRRRDEMKIEDSNDNTESAHGAGFSLGAGVNLNQFKINLAYGKYHVSSNSLIINVAYTL